MEVNVTRKHNPSRVTTKQKLKQQMDPRRNYDEVHVPPHILTSGIIPVDLVEKMDGLSYVSNLYLGTTKQPVEIVYDTGSGYLTVSHDTCKSCRRPAYNDSMSNESKPLNNKQTFSLSVMYKSFLIFYSTAVRN
jgi:hypothetical protein